jgi:omega-6 fatty acid desaturase (delta-12 desaturase)
MYLSLDVSYFLTLGLGMINAFFLVRIFIIQHDCGHRSWVKNKYFRNITGYVCSIMSAIPYNYWAKSHHLHHSHNGQLEIRDIGDINTLTVNEFKALTPWGKFQYKIYRSFIVMFIIGPIYYITIHNRLNLIKMDVFKNEKLRLYVFNLVLIGLFVGLGFWLGFAKLLLTHLTVLFFFGIIAIWFFYVQHQHEEAYKQWIKNWDYITAAIKGSTYYKIPGVFNWLTGNIGIHHIHHLNPAIPNYNLKKALKENEWINQFTTTIGFIDSLKLASHKLWDESSQRMITFKEFYLMEKSMSY